MTRTKTGPIGFGVIGCGTIGYWVYLRLLQKLTGARLVVACDPSSAARERANTIAKIPIGSDVADVLTHPDVDAVVICTPSASHAEHTLAALEAGKHVFVEKPIATSMSDAEQVIGAPMETAVVTAAGFNRRRHPLFEQAKRLIADGELGEIHAIQSAFCEPLSVDAGDWRNNRESGGGPLLDLASHHIDLVRWFLNDEVESVDCRMSSRSTEGDTAVVALKTRRQVAVQSFFSFRTARADYLEFIGERGTLLLDKHRSSMSVRVSRKWGYGTRRRVILPDASVARWRSQRLVSPSADPSYTRTLDSFIHAIDGRGQVSATLIDGIRSLDVVLAAESSARAGAPVTIRT